MPTKTADGAGAVAATKPNACLLEWPEPNTERVSSALTINKVRRNNASPA
jgi:hypothetical protein